ncbi:GOLPH3/VPS74 family protein [Actinacidiphila acididurans]|uniref:GPP34 family phosphoprotein n=1 Tax=Actinacidiphila acididurans TaxID=2784346 RepID=A0ABS2TT88_9ACTN|nr:GPP34 family phosphoprotein [Actinacidiphila acididurans]MBM9506553.1 GPP34 family phosphoprotein [Actinacidiphila acididurans]
MTTGDELLLLAIDPRKQRIRGGGRLRFALRAAELADLAESGRISLGARRIEVVDASRVTDRRLNNVLHALAGSAPAPTVKVWLEQTPRSLVTEYVSRLQDQKALRVRRWRDRGGRTRQDILSVDEPRRRALVTRLDAVARPGSSGQDSAGSDLVLAALVQAAGLAGAVHPGPRGFPARRRLAALVAADPLAATTADAAVTADRELADALVTGTDSLSRRLYRDLTDVYADATTGGHSLGHDLDPGAWSGADSTSHHTGGHHAAGGHGHHGAGSDGW